MGHHNQRSFAGVTDRDKSFFRIRMVGIGRSNREWIAKYGRGIFERNAMFAKI
jgi:hypothetical protein